MRYGEAAFGEEYGNYGTGTHALARYTLPYIMGMLKFLPTDPPGLNPTLDETKPEMKRATTLPQSVQAKTIPVKSIRIRLGMNQTEFWSPLGVTQSGGSRYENGRPMPLALRALLEMTYIKQIDFDKIHQRDLLIMNYLKKAQPELHKELGKQAKSWSLATH